MAVVPRSVRQVADLAGRILPRTAAMIGGFIMAAIGLAMTATIVLLPAGVVIGLAGVAIFLCGIFAPDMRNEPPRGR